MIIRSVMRSALSGTVAVSTGLLVLLPAPTQATADSRTAPVAGAGRRGAPATAASASPRSSASAKASASSSASASPTAPASPANGNGGLLYKPGTQVRPAPGAPAPPRDLSALSWLVADARSGDVLAAHEAHLKLPPASTLKTLFAVTALPRLPARTEHTVTDAELEDVGDGSSLVGLSAGLSYEVSDLWRGVFLSSGNDAVHVLAKMNGGWDSTVTQMQKKAKQLGALDTHVVSPDGYDAPGQVSSAFDLAVFGRAGLASREFVRYSSTREAEFPGDGYTFDIENTNRLLSGEDGVAPYRGLIGVKNGYTTDAGYTLVAAARRGGRTILVTVMNPQWGGVHAVYEEARELLDWGFRAGARVTPVGSLKPPPPPAPPRLAAKAGHSQGPVAGALRTAPVAQPAGAAVKKDTRAAVKKEEDTGSEDLLSLAFTGSASLAGFALFLVQRAYRRRDTL
ncbi:serine hydrolase [Streptomyces sp. AK02-01A]|uniref:D-alanyl-D-alanine carboxypeptidase family protein n=1 Tax=Streptomyces sp. AK02-01A TaxID=3028648 RepID=UPI0029BB9F0C|nr:serine hydrolase [Streptomyces sp. AK02-01A]MDX3854490.1 D-alanyl-D-alanine carboxypeptidase [Streptomyces sp. AK02-01A]